MWTNSAMTPSLPSACLALTRSTKAWGKVSSWPKRIPTFFIFSNPPDLWNLLGKPSLLGGPGLESAGWCGPAHGLTKTPRNSSTGGVASPRNSRHDRTLTFAAEILTISPVQGSTTSFQGAGVAAPMRLGRPKELGGLGPAKNGFAQEGGGPVIEGKHGSMEV